MNLSARRGLIPIDWPDTIVDMLDKANSAFGDTPAYSSFGGTQTFREVDRNARKLAAFFRMKLQLPTGTRVALMAPRSPDSAAATFAILRAGLVQVSLDMTYDAAPLEDRLRHAEAAVIIVDVTMVQTIASILHNTQIEHVIVIGSDALGTFFEGDKDSRLHAFNDLIVATSSINFVPPVLHADCLAFLQYHPALPDRTTGVMLTHGNIVAHIHQLQCLLEARRGVGVKMYISPIPVCDAFADTLDQILMYHLGYPEALAPDEISPVIALNNLSEAAFSARAALPVPGTEISIRDAHGVPVKRGRVGQVYAKGPQIFRAIWRDPSATREVFTADGFLRTGDFARSDQAGRLYFICRGGGLSGVLGFLPHVVAYKAALEKCVGTASAR